MIRLVISLSFATAALLLASPSVAIDLAPCVSTCTIGEVTYDCDEVCNAGDNCVGKGKLICNGICDGGTNHGNSCDSDDECPDPAKTCVGGTNDGATCSDNSDCPNETTEDKVCLCDPSGNNPNCGQTCSSRDDCRYFGGVCEGGMDDGEVCVANEDCFGGSCEEDPDAKPFCNKDVDKGKCVGADAFCAPRTHPPVSVLCAVGVDDITGSTKDDLICVGDNDVRVKARGGNDNVQKNHVIIKDGNGNVENPLGTGSLTVDLGNGDDFAAVGGDSDDWIFGGNGKDVIIACGGRNVVIGGKDDDTLIGALWCGTPEDNEVGSLYCGNDGNDSLAGFGPSHQCMDGGDGNDGCQHAYAGDDPDGEEVEDLGSARNCESTNKTMIDVACGCDDSLPDLP